MNVNIKVAEVAAEVWSRGAELSVLDNRLVYRGPRLADDDPLRAALREHRDAFLAIAREYEAEQSARAEPTPLGV